jgi:hopanoid-associated phosphorylase
MNAIFNIMPVLAAAGLGFEARIAQGPGVKVVFGQSREKFVASLHKQARAGISGIISIGVAGGLCPRLRSGDVLVASAIMDANGVRKTCPEWSKSIRKAIPNAYHQPIVASNETITSAADKEALWAGTGAWAVDMESGVAAGVAAQYGVPFAALRVVLDPAHRAVPPSALAGASEDGETDPISVIKSLIKRPGDLPGLLRLAGDTRKASLALLRSRQALGPFLGFFPLETVEFALNME